MLPELLLFLCALLALGLSLLTAVRVPVVVNWKFALLSGEYGYLLVWFPLGLAGLIGLTCRENSLLAITGILLCALAAGLFLKPVVEARRVSLTLAQRLAQAFGPGPGSHPAFTLAGLMRATPPMMTVETHEYASGLKLDFYRTPAESPPSPCVVVIHGGGWDGGDRSELSGFNDWLVAQGFAVAALDYRLAPAHPWPAQRDDVLAAIAWLKAEAVNLGIDAGRLVLLGRSAGGQIASAVGYAAHESSIRGVIALYAPHDMPFAWSVSREDDALNSIKLMRQYLGGPPDGSRQETYRSASAQHQVGSATPPTLLLHGTIDTLVWRRHSERLAVRLGEAERPHVLVELPWATHAFEFNLAGPGGQLTTFAVRWFLHAVTRP
ncbi:MAG: alpha/beta hydrolase [Cephaloticoccus sp.]|nr:alpha/beta hydrolase [Cephaloticoccus sp.]MCF7759471.1 alpha/beta hydrolase [Cephaloticoccus sp.]